ncbi:hypothetical protein [Haladaptatus salinisoli]|uniref:hypothetical protein n=1 Tax=Haladaptatus salinisoli TaxID=2884876 RepID=UPI001D0B8814|nr:hypothetical protein [Haladaptatus salinisoli]
MRWLGVLVLFLNLGLLLTGGAPREAAALVRLSLGVLGGLLLVFSTIDLPWNVEGHRPSEIGFVCLAWSVLAATLVGSNELWQVALAVVGTLSLGVIGFDIVCGGRYFGFGVDP